MKLALVDFDGTLFDFSKSLGEASLEVTEKKLTPKEVTVLPREIKKEIYDKNITKHKHLYTPYKDVVSFVNDLRKKGFTIKILTARPCSVKHHIKDILKKIGFFDEIICRPDLGVEDEDYKLSFIKGLDVKELILLEDKIDNILHIKKQIPNLLAYLVVDGVLKAFQS